MRCHDAKLLLVAQRNGDLAEADAPTLQEHLKACPACRAFARRQQQVDTIFRDAPPYVPGTISTDRIMRAIQQQQHISQQLEDLRSQQQTRVARLRPVCTPLVVLGIFGLTCLPLLAIALMLVQPGLAENTLTFLSGFIATLMVLAQYIQTGLMLVTYNNWLLLAVAFAVVVMMGMWLRLMRYPQEA
ncbi:MAG TPA: zf-HC2 domain-containing protein [Ktedonobacteraceae bacterium]|nr:zf-HC2 domain-containing protein [Ktedonobacteraceae bacterium]